MKHDSLISMLRGPFAAAVAAVSGRPPHEVDPLLRPAGDPNFGDYQCNAAMSLSKALRAKPRDIADRIVAAVTPLLADVAHPPEVAGPGFVNIRLKDEFLERHLGAIPAPPAEHERNLDRVGLPTAAVPQRVVIDYSSPNIAKQMHVGHLRSTIIGDVSARVLGFQGHDVLRQNHVGDWGTQFGMLIAHYRDHALPTAETCDDLLAAIEADYKAAQQRFKEDEQFAAAARQAVGQLQSGDDAASAVWRQICTLSRQALMCIYQRLNVMLCDCDVCGESFYNERLEPVVDELRRTLAPGRSPAGEVRADDGAQCLFLNDENGAPRFRNPDGDPLPMMIQKSDGAYLYATTDLAALRYRIKELGARRIVYVTDARQKLHFEMLFAAARAAGWVGEDVVLEHVMFGSVLGDDRKPLKTREGQNVRLADLLDEAERRALELLEARAAEESGEEPGLVPEERRAIAQRIGVAAVKYADLRNDRTTDYIFGWDKLLALQGNTAPYMLYAYARIRSIYRKAAESSGSPDVYAAGVRLCLTEPAERALALRLARLPEIIDAVAAALLPHLLCAYLYDLATDFSRFYETCPVLKAPDEAQRLSRLRLCDLTARTLRQGLGLLGIETVERM
jgi:arginyl-tRNA synthetase